MLKKTWRRSSSPAMWAVALALGAPALVQAQTQLFPLAPIQRQRPPCPMEDPLYGQYRHQYFGYFPTCWRAFPPGCGCPSPEAPNAARAFQERPRDPLPESQPMTDEERGLAPIPGEAPGAPRGRTPLPPLPGGERSPFDIDTAPNPNAPRDRTPPPEEPGTLPPRDLRANPPNAPQSSSRIDPPHSAPGENGNANGATAPLLALPDPAEGSTNATPPGAGPGPDRVGNPGPIPMRPVAPTIVNTSVPTIPNPGTPRPAMNPSQAPPMTLIESPTSGPTAMPVQAPQRRGPLSSLFNGLTSRLRR